MELVAEARDARDAPAKRASAEVTALEARALLAVDRNQNVQYFRRRMLLLPAAYVLWRYGRVFGVVHLLAYPLLAASLVMLGLEIRRVWRRTEL